MGWSRIPVSLVIICLMASYLCALLRISEYDMRAWSPIITSLAMFELSLLRKISIMPRSTLATFRAYLVGPFNLLENAFIDMLHYFRFLKSWALTYRMSTNRYFFLKSLIEIVPTHFWSLIGITKHPPPCLGIIFQ